MKTISDFSSKSKTQPLSFRRLRIASGALLAIAVSVFAAQPANAVQTSGSYVTTPPTVSGWSTGWGTSNDLNGITGWDYVGRVGSASGIYLGNGWVLTAAHVGIGNFTLSGVTYNAVSGSAQQVDSPADLTLFQIASNPGLPTLTLADSSFSLTPYSSQAVLIGYGDGGSRTNKTWGQNTVTDINQTALVETYTSTDFEMRYGTTYGTAAGYYGLGSAPYPFFTTATNNSTLAVGDSGGGDFVKVNGVWQLVGVNEAVNTTTHDSYSVQVSTYSTQIKQITSVPEASSTALLMVSGLLFGGFILVRHSKKRSATV